MGIGGHRGGGCGAAVTGCDGQLEAVAYDICMTIRFVILVFENIAERFDYFQ